MKADIGVIGLAVMGQNLVLNIIDHDYSVCIYNRTIDKIDQTMERINKKSMIIPSRSIEELVEHLKSPKIILIMIKSGSPVDTIIDNLVPLLSKGDIIIDGGNSNFKDTNRRYKNLSGKGIHFVGMGISGGEYGARYGPSIMPGGDFEAWKSIKNLFQDIAAIKDNYPCCQWIGPAGAGHFVKTVHNGIEYGYMQLISEIYALMRDGLGLTTDIMAKNFLKWSKSNLNSYLMEITSQILTKKDPITNQPLIDVILDSAGQKGTGKWTVFSALELGQSLTVISSAVFQRFLSSLKNERLIASKEYSKITQNSEPQKITIEDLERALFSAMIITYAQGFALLQIAGESYSWNLDLAQIAKVWSAGCIIRSQFLETIRHSFTTNPNLSNLLLDPDIKKQIIKRTDSLRRVVKYAIDSRISSPSFSAAVAYLDGYTSSNLPANLIQAQRDYFGAHGYKRIDDSNNKSYHTNWR